MNRGGVGARSLNIELQAALNPVGEHKVERFGWTFAPGDKVMQIENDYYGFGELDTLVPAYAATIHKSQGSEYPAVVIPVVTQHYPMLQRNLLYTAVTRGKRLVVLIGWDQSRTGAGCGFSQARRCGRPRSRDHQPRQNKNRSQF
jgi:exodeoxyribonuclease V alpha subunit